MSTHHKPLAVLLRKDRHPKGCYISELTLDEDDPFDGQCEVLRFSPMKLFDLEVGLESQFGSLSFQME